jgi:hypothetical protein
LTTNIKKYSIEGSRLNCSGCRTHVNYDNMDNVKCEDSRTFRNKKREYPRDKINELQTDGENQNIIDLYRGINELKGLPAYG